MGDRTAPSSSCAHLSSPTRSSHVFSFPPTEHSCHSLPSSATRRRPRAEACVAGDMDGLGSPTSAVASPLLENSSQTSIHRSRPFPPPPSEDTMARPSAANRLLLPLDPLPRLPDPAPIPVDTPAPTSSSAANEPTSPSFSPREAQGGDFGLRVFDEGTTIATTPTGAGHLDSAPAAPGSDEERDRPVSGLFMPRRNRFVAHTLASLQEHNAAAPQLSSASSGSFRSMSMLSCIQSSARHQTLQQPQPQVSVGNFLGSPRGGPAEERSGIEVSFAPSPVRPHPAALVEVVTDPVGQLLTNHSTELDLERVAVNHSAPVAASPAPQVTTSSLGLLPVGMLVRQSSFSTVMPQTTTTAATTAVASTVPSTASTSATATSNASHTTFTTAVPSTNHGPGADPVPLHHQHSTKDGSALNPESSATSWGGNSSGGFPAMPITTPTHSIGSGGHGGGGGRQIRVLSPPHAYHPAHQSKHHRSSPPGSQQHSSTCYPPSSIYGDSASASTTQNGTTTTNTVHQSRRSSRGGHYPHLAAIHFSTGSDDSRVLPSPAPPGDSSSSAGGEPGLVPGGGDESEHPRQPSPTSLPMYPCPSSIASATSSLRGVTPPPPTTGGYEEVRGILLNTSNTATSGSSNCPAATVPQQPLYRHATSSNRLSGGSSGIPRVASVVSLDRGGVLSGGESERSIVQSPGTPFLHTPSNTMPPLTPKRPCSQLHRREGSTFGEEVMTRPDTRSKRHMSQEVGAGGAEQGAIAPSSPILITGFKRTGSSSAVSQPPFKARTSSMPHLRPPPIIVVNEEDRIGQSPPPSSAGTSSSASVSPYNVSALATPPEGANQRPSPRSSMIHRMQVKGMCSSESSHYTGQGENGEDSSRPSEEDDGEKFTSAKAKFRLRAEAGDGVEEVHRGPGPGRNMAGVGGVGLALSLPAVTAQPSPTRPSAHRETLTSLQCKAEREEEAAAAERNPLDVDTQTKKEEEEADSEKTTTTVPVTATKSPSDALLTAPVQRPQHPRCPHPPCRTGRCIAPHPVPSPDVLALRSCSWTSAASSSMGSGTTKPFPSPPSQLSTLTTDRDATSTGSTLTALTNLTTKPSAEMTVTSGSKASTLPHGISSTRTLDAKEDKMGSSGMVSPPPATAESSQAPPQPPQPPPQPKPGVAEVVPARVTWLGTAPTISDSGAEDSRTLPLTVESSSMKASSVSPSPIPPSTAAEYGSVRGRASPAAQALGSDASPSPPPASSSSLPLHEEDPHEESASVSDATAVAAGHAAKMEMEQLEGEEGAVKKVNVPPEGVGSSPRQRPHRHRHHRRTPHQQPTQQQPPAGDANWAAAVTPTPSPRRPSACFSWCVSSYATPSPSSSSASSSTSFHTPPCMAVGGLPVTAAGSTTGPSIRHRAPGGSSTHSCLVGATHPASPSHIALAAVPTPTLPSTSYGGRISPPTMGIRPPRRQRSASIIGSISSRSSTHIASPPLHHNSSELLLSPPTLGREEETADSNSSPNLIPARVAENTTVGSSSSPNSHAVHFSEPTSERSSPSSHRQRSSTPLFTTPLGSMVCLRSPQDTLEPDAAHQHHLHHPRTDVAASSTDGVMTISPACATKDKEDEQTSRGVVRAPTRREDEKGSEARAPASAGETVLDSGHLVATLTTTAEYGDACAGLSTASKPDPNHRPYSLPSRRHVSPAGSGGAGNAVRCSRSPTSVVATTNSATSNPVGSGTNFQNRRNMNHMHNVAAVSSLPTLINGNSSIDSPCSLLLPSFQWSGYTALQYHMSRSRMGHAQPSGATITSPVTQQNQVYRVQNAFSIGSSGAYSPIMMTPNSPSAAFGPSALAESTGPGQVSSTIHVPQHQHHTPRNTYSLIRNDSSNPSHPLDSNPTKDDLVLSSSPVLGGHNQLSTTSPLPAQQALPSGATLLENSHVNASTVFWMSSGGMEMFNTVVDMQSGLAAPICTEGSSSTVASEHGAFYGCGCGAVGTLDSLWMASSSQNCPPQPPPTPLQQRHRHAYAVSGGVGMQPTTTFLAPAAAAAISSSSSSSSSGAGVLDSTCRYTASAHHRHPRHSLSGGGTPSPVLVRRDTSSSGGSADDAYRHSTGMGGNSWMPRRHPRSVHSPSSDGSGVLGLLLTVATSSSTGGISRTDTMRSVSLSQLPSPPPAVTTTGTATPGALQQQKQQGIRPWMPSTNMEEEGAGRPRGTADVEPPFQIPGDRESNDDGGNRLGSAFRSPPLPASFYPTSTTTVVPFVPSCGSELFLLREDTFEPDILLDGHNNVIANPRHNGSSMNTESESNLNLSQSVLGLGIRPPTVIADQEELGLVVTSVSGGGARVERESTPFTPPMPLAGTSSSFLQSCTDSQDPLSHTHNPAVRALRLALGLGDHQHNVRHLRAAGISPLSVITPVGVPAACWQRTPQTARVVSGGGPYGSAVYQGTLPPQVDPREGIPQGPPLVSVTSSDGSMDLERDLPHPAPAGKQ